MIICTRWRHGDVLYLVTWFDFEWAFHVQQRFPRDCVKVDYQLISMEFHLHYFKDNFSYANFVYIMAYNDSFVLVVFLI